MSSVPNSRLRPRAGSLRILLLAPTGRDAATMRDVLSQAGFASEMCSSTAELCNRIEEGAGVAVITAEALNPQSMRALESTLTGQPRWSEIPLMVFVAEPDMDRATRSFDALGPRAHVTLVDRPIRVKTLVSALKGALRSRSQQYDMRDLLEDQQKLLENERASATRLAGLAEASLAIASALSLDDVLQMITDQAANVIVSRFALIWLQVDGSVESRTICALSSGGDLSKEELDDASRSALKTMIEKMRGPARLSGEALQTMGTGRIFEGLKTVIVAPLLEREERVVGLVLLGERDGSEFSTDDEAVLIQLAQMASAAVQNARLYREAQDANRAKDDFLATLAHELRTPMTGILGWVQMLKMKGIEQDDVDTAIKMIEGSTRVQARLVEDLLDVSRIIAGKLRVELAPVELGPVVEAVVDMFRARASEADITLNAMIEDRPLSVYGDETRLHQVIWNLLSNAIKFTPPGGRVDLDLHCDGSRAVLSVKDSGSGISPEFLPHVFERFRQADNTTSRSQSGLGLGLAIVRHLVDLHNGEATVESEGLGKGTVFTISLPVLAVRVHPSELDELLTRPDMPKLEGTHILVVDDDEEAGKLVAMVLQGLGADARAVTTVSAAVRTLRSFHADIVVSDIAMPGEDGYALMRRLREIEPELGRQIPTLALTAYGRPENRNRILSSGFQKYVQKPVEPLELARAIAQMIPE